jgi:hypothetical protein
MSGRRKPSTPQAFIPGPESKAERNREWEAAQRKLPGKVTVTYRRIPETIREAIKAAAQEHYVSADEIARLVFEHGVAALERGEIKIKPRLIDGKLRIFSENE